MRKRRRQVSPVNEFCDDALVPVFLFLLDVGRRLCGVGACRYVGTVQPILVDGVNPKDPTQVCGRTPSNRLVFFEGGDELLGCTVHVHCDVSRTWTLTGHRVVDTHA